MDIAKIKDHIKSLSDIADTYQKQQDDTIFGTPLQRQKTLYMLYISTKQLLAEIDAFGQQTEKDLNN